MSSVNMQQSPSSRALSGKKKPVKVIAITAGKGGVGKTNISINLAISLAKNNNKVMILDADLGLANVDVLLGLHARRNLSHVFGGQCDLSDIVLEGPHQIKIIPASSGTVGLTQLNSTEHAGLISAFDELSDDLNYMIIDTAAGISDTVTSFLRSAHEIIVVVCDEPTSLTDAYALIKVMSKEHGVNKFHVIANMVTTKVDGRKLFEKLSAVTDQFLSVNLSFIGSILYDEMLKKSIKSQKSVCDAFPASLAAKDFKNISLKIEELNSKVDLSSGNPFFLERLLNNTVNQ